MKYLLKEDVEKVLEKYLNKKYNLTDLCNELIEEFQDFSINRNKQVWDSMLEDQTIKFIVNLVSDDETINLEYPLFYVNIEFDILEFEYKEDVYNDHVEFKEIALIEIKSINVK